jgi:hypothetical protein
MFTFVYNLKTKTMNKQEIILKLEKLLALSEAREDVYLVANLTDVIAALTREFDLSDMYAQEIRDVLNTDETMNLLNNIKIR